MLFGIKVAPQARAQDSPTPTPSATPACTASPTITPPDPDCVPYRHKCTHSEEDPAASVTPWPSATVAPLGSVGGAYQPPDHSVLQWRVFKPDDGTQGPWPVVLVIHGGGFFKGDPFDPEVEYIAKAVQASGFYTLVPTYRLAPCGRILTQPAHSDPASGRPPEETDDIESLIKAARADSHCKNGKVGLVAGSAGATLAVYAALNTIPSAPGQYPKWLGVADQPDCVVSFSGIYDMSDQVPEDDDDMDPQFAPTVQNYTNTCDRVLQRQYSPISLVNADTPASFKPLFLVNSIHDHIVPGRQIFDMQCTLINAGVPASSYELIQVTEGSFNDNHSFSLWNAPDGKTPPRPIGRDALDFLHANLDTP